MSPRGARAARGLAAAACVALAGCMGPFQAPAASAFPLEGISRMSSGSATAVAYGGGGLLLSSQGIGGPPYFGGRLVQQASRSIAVGADGVAVPWGIGSGRLFVRGNPGGSDAFAVTAGAGGGALGAAPYVTMDLGAAVGHASRDRRWEVLAGLTLAPSFTLDAALGHRPRILTTLYVGPDAAVIVRPTTSLAFGISLWARYAAALRGSGSPLAGIALSVQWTWEADGAR